MFFENSKKRKKISHRENMMIEKKKVCHDRDLNLRSDHLKKINYGGEKM